MDWLKLRKERRGLNSPSQKKDMKIKRIFLAAFTASMIITAGSFGTVNASETSEITTEEGKQYSVTAYIPVDVKLVGDQDTEGKHGDSKVILKALDDAPLPERTSIVLTDQDSYSFGPIEYTSPDTYRYEIEREVQTPSEHWTYDGEVYNVKAFVEVSNEDKLKMTMAAHGENNDNKSDVEWVDSYTKPTPTLTPTPTSTPTPTPTVAPTISVTITPVITERASSGGSSYSGGGYSSGGSYSSGGKGELVQTGDTSNTPFFIISAGAIAALLGGAVLLKGKKKKA